MRYGIIEGQASIIEIPKGTSDLGLGISWCEDEVRWTECMCVCLKLCYGTELECEHLCMMK